MRIAPLLFALLIFTAPAYAQELLPDDKLVPEVTTDYRARAEKGDKEAQLQLGLSLYRGIDGAPDYVEAAEWLEKAATQGSMEAQSYLGDMYSAGQGVEHSYEKAAGWYRKAADQGDPNSQFRLGLLYEEGSGVPQDPVEATFWVILSAQRSGAEVRAGIWEQARATLAPEQMDALEKRLHAWKPVIEKPPQEKPPEEKPAEEKK